jgi:hypothetical protein
MVAPRCRACATFGRHCEKNHRFRRAKAAQTMHSAGLWLHPLTEFGYGSDVLRPIRFEQVRYSGEFCGERRTWVEIEMNGVSADSREASG